MDNKVITTLSRAYQALGIPVVRFNFRGVGASEGKFDHGAGELDDLCTVADWVLAQFPGARLLIAGFSFGSATAAQGVYRIPGVLHLTLVAPALERYQYDKDSVFPCPVCVIQGDLDELVDAKGVYAWAESLQGEVSVIRMTEASHFFHGALTKMKTKLTAILRVCLAG